MSNETTETATQAPARQRRKLCRLSTTPDSPYEVIHLGGQAFTRETFDVRQDAYGDTQRSKIPGTVLWLSEEQINAIKAAARKRVVRLGGAVSEEEQELMPEAQRGKGRASIYVLGSRRYTAVRGDVPIARFVQISYVEPSSNPHGQQTLAQQAVGPTLADELAGEDKSAVESAPATGPAAPPSRQGSRLPK